MPGYFVHLASAPEDIRSSELGLKGLIAPDLWKKATPCAEEYLEFFYGLKGAPTYHQVFLLCSHEHGGTHFGSSLGDTNHADFNLIKKMFVDKEFDINSDFFKGYMHHLRVDHDFYANEAICNIDAFNADYEKDADSAMKQLHLDWDKTNNAIVTWYPEVKDLVSSMPEKVKKVIGFAEGKPRYVALKPMKEFMEKMRHPQTLEELLSK